jgi:S-adenosylmethionine:tRNA ribosyltransferase-isomerase
MDIAQFDFDLPQELIALRPAVPRDSARMLVVRENGLMEHSQISDLPNFLDAGDVLVANDTKVIPARFHGRRIGRGAVDPKIEVMLHRRTATDAFLAFTRPARKLEVGDRVLLAESLAATIIARGDGGEAELRFERLGTELDAAIAALGEMPLPPYIAGKRKADEQDAEDYQTVFALHKGSVAAPTAGLHFTPDLLTRLNATGVELENITLHVGAGTFLPVTATDTENHRMHPEWVRLTESTATRLNSAAKSGRRIAAVGTTVLRTLESAPRPDGLIGSFHGQTEIFITPGYQFKTADILLTNFHLPRSTLFMLVSAFSGLGVMRSAYAEAIKRRYRFYSYGDACLLFRPS